MDNQDPAVGGALEAANKIGQHASLTIAERFRAIGTFRDAMTPETRTTLERLAARQALLGTRLGRVAAEALVPQTAGFTRAMRSATIGSTRSSGVERRLYDDALREVIEPKVIQVPRRPPPATEQQLDQLISLAQREQAYAAEQQRIMAEMSANSAEMLRLTTVAQADARQSKSTASLAAGASVLALFLAGDVPFWVRIGIVGAAYTCWRYGRQVRTWLGRRPLA